VTLKRSVPAALWNLKIISPQSLHGDSININNISKVEEELNLFEKYLSWDSS